MTSMSAGSSILALEGGPTGTVEFSAADDARNLRQLLEGRAGQPLSITLAPADAETDVEGHAQGPLVALTLRVEDDDTAGHAINVHFPTAADAARFRRNLILTGALAGSIVLGSAGAMVISSQSGAPADRGSQLPTPVYERPAGHGMLEGVDPASTVSAASAAAAAATSVGASSIVDPATGRPADRGFLEGADGVPGAAASSIEAATGGPADRGSFGGVDGGLTGGAAPETSAPPISRPTGAGPLEGVDE